MKFQGIVIGYNPSRDGILAEKYQYNVQIEYGFIRHGFI